MVIDYLKVNFKDNIDRRKDTRQAGGEVNPYKRLLRKAGKLKWPGVKVPASQLSVVYACAILHANAI